MRYNLLFFILFFSSSLRAVCNDGECGPHSGMPNYLCPDGATMAGPGECIESSIGECEWEIISCSQSSVLGYFRSVEVSFCMDECSQYHLETEIDAGFGSINLISLTEDLDLSPYLDRFVEIELGDEVSCVECSAFEILSMKLSDDCQYPVECFVDPCDYVGDCQANIPVECIANYCGDCHADFYDLNGNLIDCNSIDCNPDLVCGSAETCCDGLLYPTTCCAENCDAPMGVCNDETPDCNALDSCDECVEEGCFWQTSQSWAGVGSCEEECIIADMDCFGNSEEWIAECPEVTNCFDLFGLDFGMCDMYLGVGFVDGQCQHISGCDWMIGYTDYSDAFFNSMDECEDACLMNVFTCDEINESYEALHGDEYAVCEFDNDCVAVWGDCGVGLGGCHYSVNEDQYLEDEIDGLVDMWLQGDCMEWVCDCSSPPYAQCVGGLCTSAYCMAENPAGCFQTGCDEGFECEIVESDCVPSTCFCDGFYGEWYCTEDCGGGTCVELGVLGDLNDDGQINVVDIVMAVNSILNGEFNMDADMNSDGDLNVVDVIMLVNIVLEG